VVPKGSPPAPRGDGDDEHHMPAGELGRRYMLLAEVAIRGGDGLNQSSGGEAPGAALVGIWLWALVHGSLQILKFSLPIHA
jgi:hypothetical protein